MATGLLHNASYKALFIVLEESVPTGAGSLSKGNFFRLASLVKIVATAGPEEPRTEQAVDEQAKAKEGAEQVAERVSAQGLGREVHGHDGEDGHANDDLEHARNDAAGMRQLRRTECFGVSSIVFSTGTGASIEVSHRQAPAKRHFRLDSVGPGKYERQKGVDFSETKYIALPCDY